MLPRRNKDRFLSMCKRIIDLGIPHEIYSVKGVTEIMVNTTAYKGIYPMELQFILTLNSTDELYDKVSNELDEYEVMKELKEIGVIK